MTKQDFLNKLEKGLSGLPKDEIEGRLAFYAEMIDDRIEDGLTEEQAILEIGDVEKIVSDIIGETPLLKLVKQKIKPNRRLKTWEIILLIVGAPVWFSILVSLVASAFAIYLSIWSIIISLWAIGVSLALSGVVLPIGGIIMSLSFGASGIAIIGVGVFSLGLAFPFFLACKLITKSFVVLTKKLLLIIKQAFVIKERE